MSYPCQSCNYIAVNGADLMTHVSIIHGNFFIYNPAQYYSSFPSSSTSHNHHHVLPNSETKPLVNDKPTTTIENDNLVGKYACEHCGKHFRHKGNLQRHVNTIHKKAEEFACDTCDYKTIHKHFLKNHKKRVHQKITRFFCNQCDYKSYDSGNLERHSKMVHMQIKSRYACELCDYKTFLAANLNRHVKAVHLRIKTYCCQYCSHKAGTLQSLRIHMNNKHNVDPVTHACHQCGKKFKAQHNLRRHINSVHKGLKNQVV